MPTVKKVLEAMEEETLSQDGKKELIEALQTITQFIYGKLQQKGITDDTDEIPVATLQTVTQRLIKLGIKLDFD